MREARVFAPGHLTGLFQICDQPLDPLMKGARGAGVSLQKGTSTLVRVESADETSINIKINGESVGNPVVSQNVIGKYLPRLTEPKNIIVEHIIDTPLTAGFGSSGGGAISLSLALNQAIDAGLSRIEAAQIAHIAEIECGTGLGSVFAAERGGFGVLYKPGAPGIGASISYEGSGELRVIYLYYGPISTKEALRNQDLRNRINDLGGEYVDMLYKGLTPQKFLHLSRQFSEHVGLITPSLRRVFDAMDSLDVTFTMAMFGEVAFTVQCAERVQSIVDIIRSSELGSDPVVCSIDTEGTVFLSNT